MPSGLTCLVNTSSSCTLYQIKGLYYMNTTLKIVLMVASIGMAVSASQANAAVVFHQFRSNAVNYCQAFTPGPSNTIRNRVVGAENIGSTMAVACNFHSMNNGGYGITSPVRLTMNFSNNSVSPKTVTCTLLTGYQTQGGTSQYQVTKTTTPIAANGTGQQVLTWGAADNPTTDATSLGNPLVGINCTLPTGAVLNDAYVTWLQDNGI